MPLLLFLFIQGYVVVAAAEIGEAHSIVKNHSKKKSYYSGCHIKDLFGLEGQAASLFIFNISLISN